MTGLTTGSARIFATGSAKIFGAKSGTREARINLKGKRRMKSSDGFTYT